MKTLLLILSVTLALSPAHAEEKTADQLVASKRQADMTYLQLMELMGAASAMIQEGIVRENKEMTKTGAEMIADHPAPSHKPWTIVAESEQNAFKQSLLSYDEILHTGASHIVEAAAAGNWLDASQSAYALTTACITCHVMWKNKVKTAR